MPNILINGVHGASGGAKSVLAGFLRGIDTCEVGSDYILLAPSGAEFSSLPKGMVVQTVPQWVLSQVMLPFFYVCVLPVLVWRWKVRCLLNFGDVIVPLPCKQVYYFDWAYAVYPNNAAYRLGHWMSRIKRFFKRQLIRVGINVPSWIIAQTETIRSRLSEIYGVDNVVVIPPGVVEMGYGCAPPALESIPSTVLKLVYVSRYYSHKNFEILLPVAKQMKQTSLHCCILITIPKDEGRDSDKFLNEVREMQLDDVIVNLGAVSSETIGAVYRRVDGLLMPTLLETFGLPYVEAMSEGLPILTSDRDFARDVCGINAQYFDPEDPEDVFLAVRRFCEKPNLRKKASRAHLKSCNDWSVAARKIHELIREVVL